MSPIHYGKSIDMYKNISEKLIPISILYLVHTPTRQKLP